MSHQDKTFGRTSGHNRLWRYSGSDPKWL